MIVRMVQGGSAKPVKTRSARPIVLDANLSWACSNRSGYTITTNNPAASVMLIVRSVSWKIALSCCRMDKENTPGLQTRTTARPRVVHLESLLRFFQGTSRRRHRASTHSQSHAPGPSVAILRKRVSLDQPSLPPCRFLQCHVCAAKVVIRPAC